MSDEFELCPTCRDRLGDEDKAALLEHYARGDVMRFQQYDGWLNAPPGDCVVVADEWGDALTGTSAWELRRGGIPVRIQILDGTPYKDAIRILKRMIAWISHEGASGTYVSAVSGEMRPGEWARLQKKWQREEEARVAAGCEAIPF